MAMSEPHKSDEWLTSKEAEKALRVDACKLMHLRIEGRLRFQKRGNAFMYAKDSVTQLRAEAQSFLTRMNAERHGFSSPQ